MTTTEKERLAVVENKVDTLIDEVRALSASLDSKYAAKWVQTIVGGLIAAVLLGFMGVVVHFFISDKPAQTNTPTTSTTSPSTTPATSTATTPGATASAQAQSTADKPTDTQSNSTDGGVPVTVPKLIP